MWLYWVRFSFALSVSFLDLYCRSQRQMGHALIKMITWTRDSRRKHTMPFKDFSQNQVHYHFCPYSKWDLTPVFLPRESCGQRSLVGCCPWVRTESDTTEVTHHACMHWRRKWQPTPVFLPGESQGQRSWWAAVYGVAQSRARLKWCIMYQCKSLSETQYQLDRVAYLTYNHRKYKITQQRICIFLI